MTSSASRRLLQQTFISNDMWMVASLFSQPRPQNVSTFFALLLSHRVSLITNCAAAQTKHQIKGPNIIFYIFFLLRDKTLMIVGVFFAITIKILK